MKIQLSLRKEQKLTHAFQYYNRCFKPKSLGCWSNHNEKSLSDSTLKKECRQKRAGKRDYWYCLQHQALAVTEERPRYPLKLLSTTEGIADRGAGLKSVLTLYSFS